MKRCAIYTRKSSDEGLDQQFNSLDSQRESAEYYIKAQAHQGWEIIPERYDDGGYSGGNTERPALQRLLRDIRVGRIDVIVVYKIDRLSRSMPDFIKIMEIFDEHKVNFVSVTQHFDTNTSMGRLVLNILQSFAQFEREMTTERIRDKVSASKKKGMWMGGIPPLGYDIHNKKLVINPDEEKIVRFMFDTFIEHQSVTLLYRDLKKAGHKTKSWVTAREHQRKSRSFDKSAIYNILKNPLYAGLIRHKDQIYEGEHEAIIPKDQFETVQRLIRENGKGDITATETPYLLKGLVFDCEGYAMTCAASKKSGRRYRYYTSTRAIKKSYADSAIKPVSGHVLESTVIRLIREFSEDSEFLASLIQKTEQSRERTAHGNLHKVMGDFSLLWEELSLAEQQSVIRLLIKKIIVFPQKLEITFHQNLLEQYIDQNESFYPDEDGCLVCDTPIEFKVRHGQRYIALTQNKIMMMAPDNSEDMVKAIARGFRMARKMDHNPDLTLAELARYENTDRSDLAKYIRLTQLSPSIIHKIVEGKKSLDFTLSDLMKTFPDSWKEQEKIYL